MSGTRLRFAARWHAWRTRPTQCPVCRADIDDPAAGVAQDHDELGRPVGRRRWCSQEHLDDWVRTSQEW